MPPASAAPVALADEAGLLPLAAALIEALPDPLLVLGPRDRVLHANPAAEEVLGQSRALILGRPLAVSLGPAAGTLLALVAHARGAGRSVADPGQHWVGMPPGRPILGATATALSDDSAVMLTLRPERLADRLERQARQQAGVRSMASLAAILAHEARNPLAAIRGAAQLLETAPGSDPDGALATLIREEVDRIAALLDQVDLLGDAAPAARPVNIHAVLGGVVRAAGAGYGAQVRLVESYDPSLPPVAGDGPRLARAFTNLVKNAVEAAAQPPPARLANRASRGGRAALPASHRPEVVIVTRYRPAADRGAEAAVIVDVIDNGPGIPPDRQALIFAPFVTSKAAGTGLGLAIVARIVADHAGTLDVDSHPGRTVFSVALPLAQARPVGEAPP